MVDPEAAAAFADRYDVAVVSDGANATLHGAAVIRLPNVEQRRPSSSVRIGSEHEIVPITSAEDLAAVVDRVGMAVRGEPIA